LNPEPLSPFSFELSANSTFYNPQFNPPPLKAKAGKNPKLPLPASSPPQAGKHPASSIQY